MYTYNAKVIRVIDGDTIEAMVDLGFSTWKQVTIRMYGINAPESRTRDLTEKTRGLAAKARLREILEDNNNEFVLQSHGVGKFGRCLGEIYLHSEIESVNTQLIEEGHAVKYFGGKR